jgi:UDP-N-acetylmuramoyl-tripeptide--D-alanyl-D-alanine ligase
MATTIPANLASFTAWELAVATRGDITRLADEASCVTGLVTDSRAVAPGNGFVALRGESLDGHAFLGVAIERGAAAVVVARGREVPPGAVAVVEVDDGVEAFGLLAQAHLRRWRRRLGSGARVAAVTGSAGKTTTKELCGVLLSAMGPCHRTTGNLNNRVGVPAVALALRDEPYAVFELGMSVPGEIAALASVVEPDVAALLNVGVAHAQGFGGWRSAVAREKGAILAALSPEGVAVVNLDDGAARAQILRARSRCVGFGTSPEAAVRLLRREPEGATGSRVTVDRNGERFEVFLPVPGDAVALDLVAAIAVADATVGRPIPAELIVKSVRAWQPPEGRSVTALLEGDVLVVDDSYNANPGSMRSAFATLDELRSSRRGRAIAVLGEMCELGVLSEQEHESLGAELARRRFDLVIGCGGAMDIALRRAEAGGVAVRYAAGTADAGAQIADEVRSGDVVLFKGSRAVGVEHALAAVVARHPRRSSGRGGAA